MSDLSGPSLLYIVLYFVLFIGILYLAYYFTRFLSKSVDGLSSNSNIKVIERRILYGDKMIYIIEVDSIYYVLSCDKNNMLLLDKRESLNLIDKEINNMNFKDVLAKFQIKGKQND